jgi:hypothetical protein
MKTSETKKFVQIFCKAFLIVEKIRPSRTYFHFYKRGFLNSQEVRIRVKCHRFTDKVVDYLGLEAIFRNDGAAGGLRAVPQAAQRHPLGGDVAIAALIADDNGSNAADVVLGLFGRWAAAAAATFGLCNKTPVTPNCFFF